MKRKNTFMDSVTGDLEAPIKLSETGFLNGINKKNKIKVMIIFEDGSYTGYYAKLKDYVITIKKKSYFVIPECIMSGQNPTLIYFYNNPYPIKFNYTRAKKEKDWAVAMDSGNLHTAMNSNIVNKMYSEGGMSTKNLLLITGAILIVILLILQLTGTVDVWGMLTGTANKGAV